MRACGSFSAVYYVVLIISIVIVMINLLMAIMLGNYDKARVISDKKKILEGFKLYTEERRKIPRIEENSPYFKMYGSLRSFTEIGPPKYSFE